MVNLARSNVLFRKTIISAALWTFIQSLGVENSNAQDALDSAKISLTFSAMHPRANVPESPAAFIQRGLLAERSAKGQQLPRCLYEVAWIHFRLTAPNKIDSIRITSEHLPDWMTDFYESRVLASQPFWHYASKANSESIVVSIPIDMTLESGCDSNWPAKGRYDLESAAIDSLFKDKTRLLPTIKAVQRGRRQVVLSPIFLSSVR